MPELIEDLRQLRDRLGQPNLLLVEREWVLAAWPVERVEEVE
jgi:hypothetical protein